MAVVGPSLAYLAEPRARVIVNQLMLCVEVTYKKYEVHNTGFFEVPSPLQPLLGHQQHKAALLELGRLYPALGSSAETMVRNFKELRAERNNEQHLDKPEDVLLELHRLRKQPFIAALPPFLYSAVMSADMFVANFLAAPRLLKLAAMVLMYCRDSLDHQPGLTWTWAEPRARKRAAVEQWAAAVVAAIPQLGGTTAVFAKSADQVQADAAGLGPLKLHYVIEELQVCISRCIDVGMFNTALKEQLPFAYHVVVNMDTLLGQL